MSKFLQSFSVIEPSADAIRVPVIFDSPHSGTDYPDDFDHACTTPATLKALEDCPDHYVDELFDHAPHYGAALLLAHIPRSYIDFNRASHDIDTALFKGAWPSDLTQHTPRPSTKSSSGIGLIRRIVTPGIPLYDREVRPQEIVERIKKYHAPYHTALKNYIHQAHYDFGQSWHINCHSMPSRAARPKKRYGRHAIKNIPSDFVLGNRNGTTCSTDFIHAMRGHISSMGYQVTLNDPFQGVELVRAYSAPTRGRHSLQIEINKALYMNEETGERLDTFDDFKSDVDSIIEFCTDYAQSQINLTLAAD